VFRTRDLLVRQRIQTINALRGPLTEFGLVVAQGPAPVEKLILAVQDPDTPLPEAARSILSVVIEMLALLEERIKHLDKEISRRAKEHAKEDEQARRWITVPGVGPLIATALAALGPAPEGFRSGRNFAAWLGLTPRQQSSGGKQKLGPASKMGEPTLRRLLIIGASTVVHWAPRQGAPSGSWHARAQAAPAGESGLGQQNGADHLGHDDQGWNLSSFGRGSISRPAVVDVGSVLEGEGKVRRNSR
jgi:transposase